VSCRWPQLLCIAFLRRASYCWSESGFNRIFWAIFIADFSSSHLGRAPPPTLYARKLQRLAFTCAGCHHQQDVKWGRSCYTIASSQLGSIITSFPSGLRRVKHPPSIAPWDAASRVREGTGRYTPPPSNTNNENDEIQLISKNSKKNSNQSNRICGLMFINTWTGPSSGNIFQQEWIHSPLPECPSSGSAGRTIELLWFDLFAERLCLFLLSTWVWLEER